MSVWDIYQSRIESIGTTKREARLRRESRYLSTKSPDSLSYSTVDIDGVGQEVSVINTDNLNEKFLFSMPGEDITPGGIVEWMDNHWLITERDAANEVYTRAKIIQCNYLIRWIDKDAVIHEQWCVIEDGTKYLTGQFEDRDYFVTRGDSRLALIISKNEHTSKLKRGCRFLIDDPDSEVMLAYELTKPFKLSGVYNGQGIFKFVLQEVNTTDDDNQELRIADYYKYIGADSGTDVPENTTEESPGDTSDGKKVWL